MHRVRERLRDDRLRQAFEKNPDLLLVHTLTGGVVSTTTGPGRS
jgi:hypothetical protein